MRTLEDLQRRFFALVTSPQNVAHALPALSARDPEIAPLSRWIAAAGEEQAMMRLDVYANMYFFRLLDILRADFPALAALFGDAAFHNLVTDYLLAHPSSEASVRHVGRHLADFLRTHASASRLPWAADLAALEWARLAVFDAADAVPIDAERLRDLAPTSWPALRLGMIPALRVLRVGYPVHLAWRALTEGGTLPQLPPAPSDLVVWRHTFVVYQRPAAPHEAAALVSATGGASFAEICAEAARAAESESEVAARVAAWLGRWLADGLVASV